MSDQTKLKALASFLRLAKTEGELERLLIDILTPKEIESFYDRIRIVDCLQRKLSQRETSAKTGAALVTVERGALLLKNPNIIAGMVKRAGKMSWWQKLFWCI